MEANFPSPGASCGSPYSDVTSGSPSQYSDTFGPVSPDYDSIDRLRADYSVSVNPASSADCSSEDNPAMGNSSKLVLAEYRFYNTLVVGTPDAIQAHLQHLVSKLTAGCLGLPSKTILSDSATPYSDVAQPKKPGKEGTVKRPMNAFMCFAKEERRHLMGAQPELHNARISKHLGGLWKQLPVTLQTPYRDMAEWLKQLHRQEHPEYKYRPRKRKTSGSGSSTTTTPASSSASPASGGYAADAGPKPAKSARKSAAKPRSRVRKPAGQNHVVPASTLAELPSTADYMTQFYTDVTTPTVDSQHYSPDIKPAFDEWPHQLITDVKPVVYAAPAESAAEQHESDTDAPSATHGDRQHPEPPKEELEIDDLDVLQEQELVIPIFNTMVSPTDFSDDFGFELGSENLVQGPQLDDALKFDGDLESLFGHLL